MIEEIKTYNPKLRGEVRNRRLEVVIGFIYKCTDCGTIWSTKDDAKDHACKEKIARKGVNRQADADNS